MAIFQDETAGARVDEVLRAGVERVRVHFTDLLGVSRNKVVPISMLDEVCEDGINFCISAFCVDHAGEVIEGTGLGAEVDFRDAQVVPDLSTLTVVPWERATAVAIGDVMFDGEPLPASPRQLLRRAAEEMERRGYRAVAGHELEFFLLRPGVNGGGYEQYAKQPGLVYTLSPSVDTEGVLREMEDAVRAMGLPYVGSNQEYFGSQWEINLRYDQALKAADDAHLFKLAVKEIAAKHGLVATFMGKPVQELGTSGYHLHLSLWDDAANNVFHDSEGADGLSEVCRRFIGGQLEHARAMTPIMAPTINAYKRFLAMAFAPWNVTWGHDNRTVYARIPRERGKATRVENRAGDGTANAYLASAAALFAGIDGLDRELDPGEAVSGVAYELEDRPLMPFSLGEALDALEGDEYFKRVLGEQFVHAFVAMKRSEVTRFQSAVTDWELNEYVNVL
ncbi:MAG: glutamine synthetase family protein [Actinobacteria bacterium]|nr:glutamine synthetase family protein [Actinomycetota bacterium]